MGPPPDASRSSASAALLITIVVLCLLMLGALILVVLGGLFFTSAVGPPQGRQPLVLDAVQTREPVEATLDGGPLEAVPPEPPPAAAPEASGGRLPVEPQPVDPAAESATAGEGGGIRLAGLSPIEVQDVQTGDQPLARTVQVGGREYPASIWAQPARETGSSQISYSLEDRYRRLSGAAAIADASPAADVPEADMPAAVFRIYADGNLLWESGRLQGPGDSRPFALDIGGVRLLALVVESESPAPLSRFAWIDVRLQ